MITKFQKNIIETTMIATKQLLAMKTKRFIEKSGTKERLKALDQEFSPQGDAGSDKDSLKEAEELGKNNKILD